MGGALSKVFCGGHGTVKSGANTKIRGLRNRRRATWAREKFVEELKKKLALEKKMANDLLYGDGEEDIWGSDR